MDLPVAVVEQKIKVEACVESNVKLLIGVMKNNMLLLLLFSSGENLFPIIMMMNLQSATCKYVSTDFLFSKAFAPRYVFVVSTMYPRQTFATICLEKEFSTETLAHTHRNKISKKCTAKTELTERTLKT